MSPEQALAERDIDARSDIYSAGCVLYEMLAGEPPFTGRTAQAIISKRMVDPVPSVRRLRETVSPEVDAALTRALARAPVDRFQTAAEFSSALKQAAGLAATPVPTVAHRRTPWLRPRLAVAFLVVGAALVAAAMYLRTRPDPVASAPRLALTDLEVTNRDAETDYLRSGIPDYLVSALRSLPGLEVMPMSMVRRESAITSPVELGRKLRATAVLTGTLARFGGTLAINAELVQVSDGRLLWSGQFEYPDTNYAGLIPAVVTLIADSLRLQLSGGARQDAIARSTVDPVVLDLLLRAGRTWLQGIAGAEGDSARVDSARVLFERVLERDPRNPQAMAGIGNYLGISFIRGWAVPGLSPAEVKARADSLNEPRPLARQHHPQFLEHGGDQPALPRGRLRGRPRRDRADARLDQGYAEGYRDRGIYRQELEGDLQGALEDFQQSVTLDPSVQRLNSLAAGLMAARRYPEAAAALQRSIALRESAGARTRLIAAYDKLGWRDQATRLRRHADPSGSSAAPFEAALAAGDTVAYERARRAELRKSADSLIARLTMADVPPGERYNVAELRIGALLCELGDSKQAMDLVDDLYRIRPKRLRWIVTNPDLDCLRQDPRYLPLVKAAGLEPYLRN